MRSFGFHNPVELRFGRGRLRELAEIVEPPVLVVWGQSARARTRIMESLSLRETDVHEFCGVEPNPSPATVDRGIRLASAQRVRTVVGVGGGSAMDAAKCIATVVGNAADLREFEENCRREDKVRRRLGLVQVPTTAGTGSEVTRWASLWNAQGQKSSFDHTSAYADTALIDPSLTDSMGPRLTAATALDAMAHAFESIWGVHGNPVSDALAASALALIGRWLLPTLEEPTPDRRSELALAALLAGCALSGCRSAAAHALSYEMTGRFGLEHGLAVGLLCRGLLRWTQEQAPHRVDLILRSLGVSDVEQARDFIASVFSAAGLRPRLSEFGIQPSHLPELVAAAGSADRLANHPGPIRPDVMLAVLQEIA